MELRQLRYLVALADERSFTRAAAREHVAQPALSQQLRRLEDEVGVPLVDRTTRRVALTDAGELLTERARRVLNEIAAARGELGELAGIRSGRVTIGAMPTLGQFDLALLLATFHERHLLTQACREAGFEPHVAFESTEGTRIRDLVERGLGIALMARSAAEEVGGGIRVVALSSPRPVRDVTLAWRAGRRLSPPAGALLEMARMLAAAV